MIRARSLSEVVERYDAFLIDQFGVLRGDELVEQLALTVLLAHIRAGVERDVAIEQGLQDAIAENTSLTKQVHDLQVTMAQQMDVLDEIRRHVAALSGEAGHGGA